MPEQSPLFLNTGSIEKVNGNKIVDLIHFPVTASISSSFTTTLPDPYLFATMSADITNTSNATSSSLFEFNLANRQENYFYVHNSIVGVSTSAAATGVRVGLQSNASADAFVNIKVASTLTAHTIANVGTQSPTTFALPASMVAATTIYPAFVKGLYNNSTASAQLKNVVLLQSETANLVTARSGSVSYNKFVGYKIDRGFIENFNGVSSEVFTIKQQPDNKILVGGSFNQFSNPNNKIFNFTRLIRLNLDGSIDPTFLGCTELEAGSRVNTIAIQPDNKILIGGKFSVYSGSVVSGITRLNSNGTIDTSFNAGSGISAFSQVFSIIIQSDNKILIGGSFTSYSGSTQNNIARLNSSGTIDTTFNTGGGFDDAVNSIAIQSDNKILIGGSFTSYSGSSAGAIVRLNTSGTVDTTFNTGTGFQRNSFLPPPFDFPFGGIVNSIVLEPSNKVLVGGNFDIYNGLGVSSGFTKLNTTASLDVDYSPGFSIGFGGVVGGPLPYINSIALQSDNKIIIGGDFTSIDTGSLDANQRYIARINSSGSIDTTFITGSDKNFNNISHTIAIQSDGKILVGGAFTTSNEYTQLRITRLNTDGTTNIGRFLFANSPLHLSTGSLKLISASDTISSSYLPATSSQWLSQSLATNVANTSATVFATVFDLAGLVTNQRYAANLYIIGQSAAAATGFRMRVVTGSAYRGTLYTPTSTTAPAIQNSEDGNSITSITAGTWPTVNTKFLVFGEYTFIKGATNPQVQILSETAGTAVTAFSGSVIFYREIN